MDKIIKKIIRNHEVVEQKNPDQFYQPGFSLDTQILLHDTTHRS